MKVILFLTALLCTTLELHGQYLDDVFEVKYFRLRENIRKAHIKQISELNFYPLKGENCNPDSAESRHVFQFDKKGNLVKIVTSFAGRILTINYVRDKTGDYSGKEYVFTNPDGAFVNRWTFRFQLNTQGQKMRKETIIRDTVSNRDVVNYEYNEKGQCISMTRDDKERTTMNYDQYGNMIEKRYWWNRMGEFKCENLTTYRYKKEKLIEEVLRDCEISRIINELIYDYDSDGNCIGVNERGRASHYNGDEPVKVTIIEKRLSISIDQYGNPSGESVFYNDDKTPTECVYFKFTYWQ